MKIYQKEEIMWRQSSRKIWLKESDQNTVYFHKIANRRMRMNKINAINIDGRREKIKKK